MKEIIKTIPLNDETLNYVQAAFEDYKAKQDLITMIFEIHKYDEDDSVIESKPFASYEKKFMKAKIKYDTIMKELQENYIPEEFKKDGNRFEVEFEDKVINIVRG